jgi:hypothetical protein
MVFVEIYNRIIKVEARDRENDTKNYGWFDVRHLRPPL